MATGYTVEKQEYEGAPCEHPLCDRLHRRFMVDGVHHKKVREWVLLLNGERVGDVDTFETRREGLALIEKFDEAAERARYGND